jgi:hypothetical protein
MHPQLLTLIAAQRIADLHRAADHDRVVHTATTATSSHAALAPRHAAAAQVSFLRWLPRHATAPPVSFRPREDQAGDSK